MFGFCTAPISVVRPRTERTPHPALRATLPIEGRDSSSRRRETGAVSLPPLDGEGGLSAAKVGWGAREMKG